MTTYHTPNKHDSISEYNINLTPKNIHSLRIKQM